MKHKISAAFAGYLLIGAASGLFIYCGLGADCFNSMVKGIAPYLHLSVGTSSYVIQLTMLAIVLMLGGRKQAGPGTVLGSLVVTVIVNLFGDTLAPVLEAAPLAVRTAFVLEQSAKKYSVSGAGKPALTIRRSNQIKRL